MLDKAKIISYVEGKHLADGGYFFAGVEPSSLLDTYYAIKTLILLGRNIASKDSIKNYLTDFERKGYVSDLRSLYFFIEILKALKLDIYPYRNYRKIVEKALEDRTLFNPRRTIDIETVSELEEIFFLCSLSINLQCSPDKQRIAFFILFFQNKDGGFGTEETSSTATTYYALKSLNILESLKQTNPTISFLREQERNISEYFLEDVFYIVESLRILSEKSRYTNRIAEFLNLCYRENGGFCRSKNLGIATIRDTFFAVSLLRDIESTLLF